MSRLLERVSDEVLGAVHHLDSQQWLVLSVVALVFGVFFLRGFGSRTSY